MTGDPPAQKPPRRRKRDELAIAQQRRRRIIFTGLLSIAAVAFVSVLFVQNPDIDSKRNFAQCQTEGLSQYPGTTGGGDWADVGLSPQPTSSSTLGQEGGLLREFIISCMGMRGYIYVCGDSGGRPADCYKLPNAARSSFFIDRKWLTLSEAFLVTIFLVVVLTFFGLGA